VQVPHWSAAVRVGMLIDKVTSRQEIFNSVNISEGAAIFLNTLVAR